MLDELHGEVSHAAARAVEQDALARLDVRGLVVDLRGKNGMPWSGTAL